MQLLLFSLLCVLGCSGLKAGVARVDATPKLPAPLAGYNHGARRVPHWPLPRLTNTTTFMTPSQGSLTPLYVRALVLDDGQESACFLTLDAIGAGGGIIVEAWQIAVDNGYKYPLENVILTASHSHSAAGGDNPYFLWQMAPATDLLIPEIRAQLTQDIASAMVQAQASMVDALIDGTSTTLIGITKNRRGGKHPPLLPGTIDPHLGVLRIDNANTKKTFAVVWNFAWHGVCYGPDNMKFSGDIMGRVNDIIEQDMAGVTSLFQQADAGDIDPANGMCDNAPDFKGSNIAATKIKQVVDGLTPVSGATLDVNSAMVNFGPTDLNYTLSRFNNCDHGGFLDICSICRILDCELNAHFNSGWIANEARFSAVRLNVGSKSIAFVTMPGEPLVELGWIVRNTTQDLGFTHTFVLGYSQAHFGYFATPDQYVQGGYESQLTFWGIDTALRVADNVKKVAEKIAPKFF